MNEIKKITPVLDENGHCGEAGYCKTMLYDFDRSKIAASPFRIKEWDFYQVSNPDFMAQLTIGHSAYAGTVCATLVDFRDGKRYETLVPLVFPLGKLGLPKTADVPHVVDFKRKKFEMKFEVTDKGRQLTCRALGKDCEIDLWFDQPHKESMTILIPFAEPQQFYLNQKINCMPASGFFRFGDKKFVFDPETSFGLLDWGRGVWPYRQEWWWGNGSGKVEGVPFGFNIGWGFGDTSKATENMLFYDGIAHKTGKVWAELETDADGNKQWMKPWRFTSDDGRFEMIFTPKFDNYTDNNFIIAHNRCHQVFGYFNGKAVLDDGKVLDVKDFFAFCECSNNRW